MAGAGPCSITSIDCAHPIHVSSIKANKQIVLGTVTTTINYIDGNGGAKPSLLQVASTGVTGLYAVLRNPGEQVSNADGTFIFDISGKASSAGLATFTFTICGKQCSFVRAVEPDVADCDGCLPAPEECEPDFPAKCAEMTPDACLKYDGESFPCYNITTGMTLKQVLTNLVLNTDC
jgi:hypothetical protein